jgi:VIT1/CCC1 family predicted Fe2+/Mn2+ transporter
MATGQRGLKTAARSGSRPRRHRESHRNGSVGWLRAAVLGANDGILSTSSLILGVAAANTPHGSIVVAGLAGLVAGAMSMAAGEYVSVHSQADNERAELDRERAELEADDAAEHRELALIYERRGLEPALAKQVASQLMARDALGAHARDELGLSERSRARPIQAAFASAASFAVGAALPLLVAGLGPRAMLVPLVSGASLAFLALLGAVAARAAGAPIVPGATRVAFWGALAMGVTATVGHFVGGGIAP